MNSKELNINPINPSVNVVSLSHDGRGIAQINGKTTFIEGALPSEQVTLTYQKRRKKYDEASVLHIETSSPDRAIPQCEFFENCGGCSLQHLEPLSQVKHKEKVLLEQLKHFGGAIPEQILPPLTGPVYGYRRKARLGVKFVTKKDKLLIGFREKRSNFLLEMNGCETLHPKIGKLIPELNVLISSLTINKEIPQIEVAVGDTDSALIIRHLEPMADSDQERLRSFGEQHQIQIYLQPAGPNSIFPIWPQNCSSRLSYKLPEFDLQFQFHPADFTQVNSHINQLMVKQALDLLQPKPTEKILDLFCGIGNFTLPLAKYAQHVTGVEGSQTSVDRAIENAAHNNITNTSFYMSDLHSSAQLLSNQAPWANQCYDSILLDPPRTGALELMDLIPSLGAKKIVYVSCNPATLARDIGILTQKHGFTLVSTGIMDMFPHTTHVESIAYLVKKG